MKKANFNKRSQLIVIGILIIAFMGILMINTDSVTAEKESQSISAVKNTVVDGSDEAALSDYAPSIFPSMLKLLSALALVIVCIYAALFLFKKLMGKKYSGNRKSNILEVLETTYVGPKKTISLIRVADKSVLIGSTENQISVLSELNEEKTGEIIKSLKNEIESENFKNLFQTASDKIREMSVKRKTKAALEV